MDKQIICVLCRHYDWKKPETHNCKAFPDGIPDEILFGENDHKKPLPEQKNKIVFKPF